MCSIYIYIAKLGLESWFSCFEIMLASASAKLQSSQRQPPNKPNHQTQFFHHNSSHTRLKHDMDSSIPLQIAETIQTASINRAPSPSHDINPSTAASAKQPVTLSSSSPDKYVYDDDIDIDIDEEEDDIPYNVLKPTPRRASLPPLPDLRFEQSYLASISHAETNWRVAYITIRDQVRPPLLLLVGSVRQRYKLY